jgi:hypothetical protein
MTERDEEISTAMPKDLDALPRRGGFRLRGLEMTRLESFVDATFAFAVSLLVIAGQQVPDDLDTLLRAFNNVPAFAASIAVMGFFWRGHWLWSRRFGLEDGVSSLISWAMIFTMLIYVYQLKIIFGGMFYGFERWPSRATDQRSFRCKRPRCFRALRPGLHRHRARDRAPLLACMAIARAFAIEQRGTIHDSRRDRGLVHSGQRRPSLVHPGADFASRPDLMVRLGLLFHVLFVSRLSPPAPAQIRQVGSNVGASIIARS